MSVGLPGSGIGGVFYLLSALWMPVDGAMRSVRKRNRRSVHLIARQAMLAIAIIGAIYLTGIGIEQLMVALQSAEHATGRGAATLADTPRVFRQAAFFITFATLGAVLLSVQLARVLFARAEASAGIEEVDERKAA